MAPGELRKVVKKFAKKSMSRMSENDTILCSKRMCLYTEYRRVDDLTVAYTFYSDVSEYEEQLHPRVYMTSKKSSKSLSKGKTETRNAIDN